MGKELLAVFVGGGLGSLFRYFISKSLGPWSGQWPLGTFIANLIACLIFGMIAGFMIVKSPSESIWKLFITTGFCGGLSTFSTFNAEIYNYLKSGLYLMAASYILISIVVCLVAFVAATFIFSK